MTRLRVVREQFKEIEQERQYFAEVTALLQHIFDTIPRNIGRFVGMNAERSP